MGDKFTEFMDSGSAFLEHYGVKGMKWGVRRYQPETHRTDSGKEKIKTSNRLTDREKQITRNHAIKAIAKTYGLTAAASMAVSAGMALAVAMGMPAFAIGGAVIGSGLGTLGAQQAIGENAKLAKDMAYEQNYSYKKK